jgi:hypothetical protein
MKSQSTNIQIGNIVACTSPSVETFLNNNDIIDISCFEIINYDNKTKIYTIKLMLLISPVIKKIEQTFNVTFTYLKPLFVLCHAPYVIKFLKKTYMIDFNRFKVISYNEKSDKYKIELAILQKYRSDPVQIHKIFNSKSYHLELYNNKTKIIKKRLIHIKDNDISDNFFVSAGHGSDPISNSYISLKPNQRVIIQCHNNHNTTVPLGNHVIHKLLYTCNNNDDLKECIKNEYISYDKASINFNTNNTLNTNSKTLLCIYKNKVPNISLSYKGYGDNYTMKNLRYGVFKLPFKLLVNNKKRKTHIKKLFLKTKKVDPYISKRQGIDYDNKTITPYYDYLHKNASYTKVASEHSFTNNNITNLHKVINRLNKITGDEGFTLHISTCRGYDDN